MNGLRLRGKVGVLTGVGAEQLRDRGGHLARARRYPRAPDVNLCKVPSVMSLEKVSNSDSAALCWLPRPASTVPSVWRSALGLPDVRS